MIRKAAKNTTGLLKYPLNEKSKIVESQKRNLIEYQKNIG